MNIIDRIQWHEGMLLSPQHFQTESTRVDSLIADHVLGRQEEAWGIRVLELDSNLLTGGILRVLKLEAFMPDGTAIKWDAAVEDVALELKVSDYSAFIKENRKIDIYLALPVSTKRNKEGLFRFSEKTTLPVGDDYSDSEAIDIPRLSPNIKIIGGEQPSSLYVSFKLCELYEDNGVTKIGDYIPPLVTINASIFLTSRLKTISKGLREKAVFLARQVSSVKFSPADADQFSTNQRLRTIVMLLPKLEGLMQMDGVSPRALYLILCEVLGPISQLKIGGIPEIPPKYDHQKLFSVFDSIFKMIIGSISEVSQNYHEVPFKKIDLGYEIVLKPEWIKSSLVLGLKGVDKSYVNSWVKSVIIEKSTEIENCRQKRVLGMKRRKIEEFSAMQLKSLPGVNLIEVICPKSLEDSEYKIVVATEVSQNKSDELKDLCLFVQGSFED